MSAIRRLQTAIVLLVVMVLGSPALAACCVWSAEPMTCCDKTDGHRLVAPCCVTSPQAPQQQLPATANLSKLEPGGPALLAVQPPVVAVAAGDPTAAVVRFNGPPGSNPLYLRLSVIRR
jgi:hypothetical protein